MPNVLEVGPFESAVGQDSTLEAGMLEVGPAKVRRPHGDTSVIFQQHPAAHVPMSLLATAQGTIKACVCKVRIHCVCLTQPARCNRSDCEMLKLKSKEAAVRHPAWLRKGSHPPGNRQSY